MIHLLWFQQHEADPEDTISESDDSERQPKQYTPMEVKENDHKHREMHACFCIIQAKFELPQEKSEIFIQFILRNLHCCIFSLMFYS